MANQSTFAAPQKADNWRAVVGNKLPDGTTDVTEGIYHDGTVHLGNANTNSTTRFKHLGIASYTGNGTFTSQVIQTNIPKDSYLMPSIDLKGYAYETGNTVDVQICFYTYGIPSGDIRNTVWQSKGTSSPLAIRAGWNASNLLALEITWATTDDYFNRYGIDAYSDGNNSAQQDSWFENWSITNTLFDASFTQVVNLVNKDKALTLPFATPAQTIAGTATNLIVNPADLTAKLANQPASGACADREDVVWNGTILQGAAKHYSQRAVLYKGTIGVLTTTPKVIGTYTITNPSQCRDFAGKFEAFLQAKNVIGPFPAVVDSVVISTSINGILVGAGEEPGTGSGYNGNYGEHSNTWFNDFFTIPAGGSITFDVTAVNGGTAMSGYFGLTYVGQTV